MNKSKLSSSGPETQTTLRKQLNRTLIAVFKIFFRLSQNMESDSEYFSMDFYRGLVYDNELFDIAKLLDIAAIYG